MKNKFLLLGATAILSTGAILANAASVNENTANLTVSVGVYVPINLRSAEDVNFGKILVTDPSSPITITMNPSTGVVTPGAGASIASNGSLGYVDADELRADYDIILPNSVNLYNTSENESEAMCSDQQYAADCHIITYVPSKDLATGTKYNIGGTLTIPASAEHGGFIEGAYSGAFTVTAMAKD